MLRIKFKEILRRPQENKPFYFLNNVSGFLLFIHLLIFIYCNLANSTEVTDLFCQGGLGLKATWRALHMVSSSLLVDTCMTESSYLHITEPLCLLPNEGKSFLSTAKSERTVVYVWPIFLRSSGSALSFKKQSSISWNAWHQSLFGFH